MGGNVFEASCYNLKQANMILKCIKSNTAVLDVSFWDTLEDCHN
jgi:hypothetical protein